MTKRRLILLLLFVAPASLVAQGQRGVVTDTAGRPLQGADVIQASTGARTRSDSLGRFALATGRALRDTLKVRLIGYYPLEVEIARRDRDLVLRLRPMPTMLDRRVIIDHHRCDPTSLGGFECRRAAGIGHFRGSDELRALKPLRWADMFDGMPNLRRTFSRGPYGMDIRVATPPGLCLVEIWNGQPPMRKFGDMPFAPDEFWLPNDVIAIEFFDNPRDVPAPYKGYAWPEGGPPCALVNYWLRGADRGNPAAR